MKKGIRQAVEDVGLITAGAVFVAAGLVVFTVPNNIAPGGVSGLATALASISRLPVGLWTLLLNLPLIVLAWWKLGPRPLVKTVFATVLLSALIDVFTPVLPTYTNNVLLASVFGGGMFGVGMGLIFIRGASTGGTDLVSLLLNRMFPNVSVATLLMIVDALVVLFAVCIFRDIEIALYSAVTIFITGKVIDGLMQGVDYAKVIYVVTEHGEKISAHLSCEMELGVTVVCAKGGYTWRDKHLLMLVVKRRVFAQTLRCIKEIDPAAFLFVSNATEVHGEGFKPMAG